MAALNQLVQETLLTYAGGGYNSTTFAMCDESERAFAVLIVDTKIHRHPAAIMVMARIEGEWVLVEADNTDRPLVDRLVAAGIPRERIILTYAGETIPQPHDRNA